MWRPMWKSPMQLPVELHHGSQLDDTRGIGFHWLHHMATRGIRFQCLHHMTNAKPRKNPRKILGKPMFTYF